MRKTGRNDRRVGRNRNPIPVGLAEGMGFTLGAKMFDRMVQAIPKGKRSKFARELEAMKKKAKKRNPDMDLSDVEEMAEKFHGREPNEVIEVDEVETYSDLAVLGELVELNVLSNDGRNEVLISFKQDRPQLCCDAEGKNLEIVGGDQSLDIDEEKASKLFQERLNKRLLPIGLITSVAYETDKHHLEDSTGTIDVYEHEFGEEGGEYPSLIYNETDQKLLIVGGSYEILDVGIKD